MPKPQPHAQALKERSAPPKAAPGGAAGTAVFALAVFVGAFLLFQIQPIMGKFILPRFGGGSDVWVVCLLFFQLLLLAGYAYAHLLTWALHRRAQVMVHAVMLVVALVTVALALRADQIPMPSGNPALGVLILLGATVGLPFMVLSATSPLIQGWFATTFPGRPVYRLYALSNVGSLLALLSYPVLIEPALTRSGQLIGWWVGLGVLAGLVAMCARRLSRSAGSAPSLETASTSPIDPREGQAGSGGWVRPMWLALPAVAVVELMSVTTAITQDIAPIPLLWILPLALYLVSFVICFDRPGWYRRWAFVAAFAVLAVLVHQMRRYHIRMPAIVEVAVYCLMLLSCCIICHGELYRLRPAPRRLTQYYLLMSVGGAIGGLFVAILAPLLFDSYVELELGIAAVGALVVLRAWNIRMPARVAAALAVGALASYLLLAGYRQSPFAGDQLLVRTRNFYGVLGVWDTNPNDPIKHVRSLSHGTTMHGLQIVHPDGRGIPTAYYVPSSGVGRSIAALRQRGALNVGVVGLGVGTLAAYLGEQDRISFYEIDPQVEALAREHFSFLADCRGKVEVHIGDGRLVLAGQAPQQFDLLVLDAFSSDSVPLHLLTDEAMKAYVRHLRPDGILAFHVSTSNLDLPPVVAELAAANGLSGVVVRDRAYQQVAGQSSVWVMLTPTAPVLLWLTSSPDCTVLHRKAGQALWSDDYVNVVQAMKPRKQWQWRRAL